MHTYKLITANQYYNKANTYKLITANQYYNKANAYLQTHYS